MVWLWGIVIKYIWPPVWHAICRFWSVFLVGLIVLSCWLWWRGYIAKVKNEACKACISDYTKTHPTYGNVGTVINDGLTPIVKLGVYRVELGAYWKAKK